MRGTMMDFELTVGSLLRHANRFHGKREIASRLRSGAVHHYSYADLHKRCGRLANALADLGVGEGDRVGTIAGNSFRHLEAYFAAPAMGAVVHTINPRLFPEQIEFIVNHAQDKILLIDPEFVDVVSRLRGSLPSVEHILVLADDGDELGGFASYEEKIAAYDEQFDWPAVDERKGAALCYTSGTTGNPKGVLYTHRSIVLHTMMVSGADWFAVRKRDAVMPVVPMYHVMGWSLPYAAAMNGAKLVLPRSALDSASLLELINREKVTLAAGVPTIWSDMIAYLEEERKDLASLQCVIVGGTAPTPALIKALEDHGVRTLHGWGMTETSSNGLLNTPDEKTDEMDSESRREFLRKQGRAPYPVNAKIVTASGDEAPWDGTTFGNLLVSGPTIASHYFGTGDGTAPDAGPVWLDTGDIATIDARGYVEIVDRDKDIIKSGGEWISSIALENVACDHPDVQEAAVISIPHPRWDERPMLIVVPKAGHKPEAAGLLAFFEGKVAKWWIPDDVAIVDKLPRQATGKVSKADLRRQYIDAANQTKN
jgi:fatty-acyl-CoA synthase